MKRSVLSICFVAIMALASYASVSTPFIVPNPVLILTGQAPFTNGGKQLIRYNYAIFNAEAFSKEMFAAAPALPPCGANTKSSRSWIDVFDARGKRLYGFCALNDITGQGKIWFDLAAGELPPSWVYIEINDRQTNTKYKSNLAETTL